METIIEGKGKLISADTTEQNSIPQSITPRQARLILLQMNLLDEVDAILATNREWQISWEYANEIQRDSPLIAALAAQLGLTGEQIDNMFIEGAKL